MITLDERQTNEALPFDRLIETLREMFAAGCSVPQRHSHVVNTAEGSGTVLIMPAWNEKYLGIKTVNIYPQNSQRGLPGLFSVFTLFDSSTGLPLAQLDGNVITSRRTAAASALAASYLAKKNSRRLLVVGAGRVGRLLPDAYRAVFPLEQIDVWNRDPAAADLLAATLRESDMASMSVGRWSLEAAARRADIVSTATLSCEPIVKGEWLAPGAHLDLIGSFTPEMRETDDTAFRDAKLFVDTEEALQKSGELLGPMSRGVFCANDVVATLAGLCAGAHLGRASHGERTVFKSVGSALEDLAAAIQAYEHWREMTT
ncbi:ornithine cyclodeaminase family protein [Variovorax ureilyticus]|uniref:Ornithine cyclodeaminase family protein n=1 Tax=Variovorax ureilyticus TaxID=1836198 RepID=A0ABU8VM72_9BURK